MEYSLKFILIGIAIIFNFAGWFYAIQIYLRPSPHGWTWVSVAVGTLIVSIGVMFGTYVILDHFGELQRLWFLLFLDPAMLLIVGAPMAILQIFKKIREDREANGNLE
jgi:hypothetical protein